MGWIGKAAAVAAVVTACFAGAVAPAASQTASQACKNACSQQHTACQRRAINTDTCMRRWLACKKKCTARPS